MQNANPLADRLRPKTLANFFGQDHLLGPSKILEQMLQNRSLSSIIFWGPPGVGKTTLAKIIAGDLKTKFIASSAVLIGVSDIKKLAVEAQQDANFFKTKTILFLDEIHRFNKAQQDVLLPYVEQGILTLIGATTENPSFSINSALLSRCRVLTLKHLDRNDLKQVLKNALTDGKLTLEDGRVIEGPNPQLTAEEHIKGINRLHSFAERLADGRPVTVGAVAHGFEITALLTYLANKGVVDKAGLDKILGDDEVKPADVMSVEMDGDKAVLKFNDEEFDIDLEKE